MEWLPGWLPRVQLDEAAAKVLAMRFAVTPYDILDLIDVLVRQRVNHLCVISLTP